MSSQLAIVVAAIQLWRQAGGNLIYYQGRLAVHWLLPVPVARQQLFMVKAHENDNIFFFWVHAVSLIQHFIQSAGSPTRRPFFLHQIAQRTQVKVQVFILEPEHLFQFPHLLFQLHQGFADALNFLIGQ